MLIRKNGTPPVLVSSNSLSMRQAEVCLRSSLMITATPFTITFTTAAFDRSSLWLFEASPYRATRKGQPSSLVRHDAFASS
jgi:hypothetical protein